MAAHDRHGAWFARRSVHEGLPFDRWKLAMQGEFAESLAVTGGPGAGSIRGIGADKVLEKQVVKGLGKMEGMFTFWDMALALADNPSLPPFCPVSWSYGT
jgi:hypothetical protein